MADTQPRQPLPEEITSSLAGVWKRYTDWRPTDASSEVAGNVVRCRIPDSVRAFEERVTESGEELADRLLSYRRDATAAVARSTRCRVIGMISERDAKTDVTREVFILDAPPKRARFGEPDWIVS